MISGIINVYKESGYTSHDVVARMRGIFSQKKIGHTGTLDPDAVGVLPICLGKATKVCELITDKDKEYQCVLLLGTTTDTQDTTGKILTKKEVNITKEELIRTIMSFEGEIDQIPPMYSALKVNGKKLYELARKGIEVERKPRKVTINKIQIEEITENEVTMTVSCSKGTYIRTLCHDIGMKMGCGGCMKYLKRTKSADFTIDKSLTLSELETLVQANNYETFLQPIDTVFQKYPKLTAIPEANKHLYNGNSLNQDFIKNQITIEVLEGQNYRVYDSENTFIGIYQWKEKKLNFKPMKLFMEKDGQKWNT